MKKRLIDKIVLLIRMEKFTLAIDIVSGILDFDQIYD